MKGHYFRTNSIMTCKLDLKLSMSVSDISLQQEILALRPSLVYSLLPVTACINFLDASPNFNYLIIDHVNALLV